MQIYNAISQGVLGRYDESYANFSQTNESSVSNVVSSSSISGKPTVTKVTTKIATKGGKHPVAKAGTHYALKYACTPTDKSSKGGQAGYIPLVGNGAKLPWTSKTLTKDAYTCTFKVTNAQNTNKLDEVASSIFTRL